MTRRQRKTNEEVIEKNNSEMNGDVQEEVGADTSIPNEIVENIEDPEEYPDIEEVFDEYEGRVNETIYVDPEFEEYFDDSQEEDISDEEFSRYAEKIRNQFFNNSEEDCEDYHECDCGSCHNYSPYPRYNPLDDFFYGETVVTLNEKHKKVGLAALMGTVAIISYLFGKSRRH